MALTNYDSTVYDTPVYRPPTFTGTDGATTQSRTPSSGSSGTGDFVTTPPLGTPHPPEGTNSGTAVPRNPLAPPPEYHPPPPPPVPKPPPPPSTGDTLDWHNPAPWVTALFNRQTNFQAVYPSQYWIDLITKDAGAHSADYWAARIENEGIHHFSDTGQKSQPGGGDDGFDFSTFNFGGLFDDPATVELMKFLQTRVGQLTTPINDPSGEAAKQAILDAMGRLTSLSNTPLPPLPPVRDVPDLSGKFDALIKAINDSSQSISGPTAQYRGILDNLVKELSQPAFSTDQLAQLKTAAVDTLNHEHQQALDNKTRAMGMQGVPPSSGVAQEALKNVDQQYQTLKAQALQAQNTAEIAMINERRQQLMQAASSSLTAAQQQAAQEQAALAAQMNLLLNQQTQGINVRGQDITLQDAAARRALDERTQNMNLATGGASLAQALDSLARGQRTEQNANLNTAMQLLGIPIQLSSDRLSQALQVLGLGSGSTSPTNLLSALTGISQQANLGNATNSTNSTNWGTALGNLIANFGKK